jgi:hypothetical protein
MKPLGRTPRNVLLGFHVLFASFWMGGVAALVLVSILGARPHHADALTLARRALQWLDWTIIIPSCLGSLATGALFSLLTPWGFFKHTWITIKWILTVAMILFGVFFLGPWVDGTARLAGERGLVALDDSLYSVTALRILGFSVVQIALLVFMLFLSTLKPFGKRGAKGITSEGEA